MPTLTFNLYGLDPDNAHFSSLHMPLYDTFVMGNLRKQGLLVSGLSSDYENQRRGIYIIAPESRAEEITGMLQRQNATPRISNIQISTSSIIVKNIIYGVLSARIQELGQQDLLFLPTRWNEFGELDFSFPEIVARSKPHGLVSVRRNCGLRVEHLENGISLQLDTRLRRVSSLRLNRLLEIMRASGIANEAVNELACLVDPVEDTAGPRIEGYLTDATTPDRVSVSSREGEVTVAAEKITLNPKFSQVKMFLASVIRENIREAEDAIRVDIKRPVGTFNTQAECISRIKELFFPLNVGGVTYDLETRPFEMELESSEESV